MKISRAAQSNNGTSRWLLRWLSYVVIMSIFCLGQTTASGQDPVKKGARRDVTVIPRVWSAEFHENDHSVSCPDGVMIGMAHDGDENGPTRYRCGKVHQFVDLPPVERVWSDNLTESDHAYACPKNKVMTGRSHDDDENGDTRYECAKLKDDWGNDIQVLPGDEVNAGDFEGSSFECPENQVITYRKHDGDTESGNVYFKCATLW